jgi:hypothetical protein
MQDERRLERPPASVLSPSKPQAHTSLSPPLSRPTSGEGQPSISSSRRDTSPAPWAARVAVTPALGRAVRHARDLATGLSGSLTDALQEVGHVTDAVAMHAQVGELLRRAELQHARLAAALEAARSTLRANAPTDAPEDAD